MLYDHDHFFHFFQLDDDIEEHQPRFTILTKQHKNAIRCLRKVSFVMLLSFFPLNNTTSLAD